MPDKTSVSEAAVERYLMTLCSRLRQAEDKAGERATFGNVFLTAIPFKEGPASGTGERKIVTRTLADAITHARRWDRPEWSVYVCVNLIGPDFRDRRKDTVGYILVMHGEIDFKDHPGADAQEILACIAQLPIPPTMIVHSGNGLHLYWVLEEPVPATPETIARIEALNLRIANVIGGDERAFTAERLLRLPGTHNAKYGAWKEVRIVETTGEIASLENLEEWLADQEPVIVAPQREGQPRATAGAARSLLPPENNYLAIAQTLGMSTPIDVEERLARMSYQGAGETSIHQTQVECTASMLSSGMTIIEVVDTLLEATQRAAGAEGAKWNWKAEEKALRNMCATWVRKNPELASSAQPKVTKLADRRREAIPLIANGQQAPDIPIAEGVVFPPIPTQGAKVLNFGGSVPPPSDDAGLSKKKGSDKTHIQLANVFILAMHDRDEDLIITADQMWHYADGLWTPAPLDGQRWLAWQIQIAATALGLKSDNRLINETRGWLMRSSELFHPEVEWDAHGLIPTRSGLLDPADGEVQPAEAEHRMTWRVECEYDPEAACPWWLRMLEDTFEFLSPPERARTLGLIQEIAGMSLIQDKPKALSKALVLQGGTDSGKTQLLSVLGGLTSDRPISTTFDTLATTHGLMEFRRRAPWVLHEAFDQSKWHFSSVVKSILTGDPVQINMKNGPLVTQRVRAPVFWGTNHPPQFKEATKAIVNRLVVIPCRRHFDEASPMGAALEATRRRYSEPAAMVLATELPGILNWALEGLQRAVARGHFDLPDEVLETRSAIRIDSNLSAGFIEECGTFHPDGMVAMPDLGAAHEMWWRENKGEGGGSPSNESVGRALAALGDQRIASHRDKTRRYVIGMHLNPVGMDYWRAAKDSTIAAGKTSRISDEDEVNRAIPAAWDDKDFVMRVRAEFKRRSEKEEK